MFNRQNREYLKLATWPVFFLGLGLGLYLYLGPSRGYQELERSQDALHRAKSWRSVARVRTDDGAWPVNGTRDVVCPSDFVETYTDPQQPGVLLGRAVVHGIFYNQHLDGSWIHNRDPYFLAPDCGKGPLLAGMGFLYPPLEEIARNGEIRRGKHGMTEHGKCLWWDVIPSKGSPPRYSVCLDESSHLPFEVSSEQFGFSGLFWDWDVTAISPPIITE